MNLKTGHFFLAALFSCICFSANSQKLFTLLSSQETGVDFVNTITDTKEANILIYEAFYEGGGVAIEDLNGDGLLDIYLTGNQVSDKLYLNKGDLKFEDVTQQSGILNKGGWSTGVSIVDINNDGHQDIYVCKSLYDDRPDLRVNELYINQGNGQFMESAAEYGLNDPWRSIHANFFDYDRDGDFDLFLINQPPNPSILSPLENQNYLDPKLTYRFLENTGNRFEEKTLEVGLQNVGFGLSSVSVDINQDGWQDLYVANDYEGPDFLYVNNQDCTFTNKIDEYIQHISFFSMGADAADINNDGLEDIMVVDMVAEDNYRIKANMSGMNPDQFWQTVELGGHYQYMFNTLQMNNGIVNGKQTFSDIAQLAGVASTDWSWSPLIADFDNDGYKDIFVSNGIKRDVRATDALKKLDYYLQKSIDTFTKENPNAGDVSIWEIVSLDTLLSIFPQQKITNYIYQNQGDLTFEKKMSDWGLDQETFSNGAAYADLDNDGDLDLVVSNVDEEVFVYRNNSEELTDSRFVSVRFADGGKSKSFFGTRATAYYQGKQQSGSLTSSRGFFSSSQQSIHFGFESPVKKLDSLSIRWADGTFSTLKKVKTNQHLILDKSELSSDTRKDIFLDETLLSIVTDQYQPIVHEENEFDDYEREILLPHKMSALGPAMAVADVNGDGLDDFFIGGAIGRSGQLFMQNVDGSFNSDERSYNGYLYHEDMGAAFFDADADGDLDLYVVSGGNEYDAGASLYQDRLYLNNGTGQFDLADDYLPEIRSSGGQVRPLDFDNDGDVDLFVAGRQVPGQYPRPAESLLLINQLSETGKPGFEKQDISGFDQLGMVSDAVWSDMDGDGDSDLVVVGEWMPIIFFENTGQTLVRKVEIPNSTGWWYSIETADLDGDGDQDFVLGNLGENYKYKASTDAPFTVNYGDFDQNGVGDIILGYYNYGEHYPLRGRSCSSQQAPILASSFPSYNQFASASLIEVYGSSFLSQSLEYKANTFSSIALMNEGSSNFTMQSLPSEAQLSSINDIIIKDFNKDHIPDLLMAGNMYGSEIETTRNDAGMGLVLIGKGDGTFIPLQPAQSGILLPYDVKSLSVIDQPTGQRILVGVNDGPIQIIEQKKLDTEN